MTTEPSRARAGEVQHGLGRLLSHLQESGDDLVAEGEKQRLVVEFVRDLQARAPGGDEGRCATTTGGALAPATVCCASHRGRPGRGVPRGGRPVHSAA
ncbi:hypothetical protein AB0I97_13930 [Streptomyces sp. NPDC049951]|uniref:hypothetical protein n=1 Tax=unclassified Streptomyces TaxID=2593676 RepID=UPI00131D3F24|nr:hypothetical protein [Streptomyces sp. NRRL S-325]